MNENKLFFYFIYYYIIKKNRYYNLDNKFIMEDMNQD